MKLSQFQKHIDQLYGAKDRARGVDGTFMYLIEEVGELATALREGSLEDQAGEFADVVAWTASLAALAGVDLEKAVSEKYAACSGCQNIPCSCSSKP